MTLSEIYEMVIRHQFLIHAYTTLISKENYVICRYSHFKVCT